jgi:pyruvate formate lyase activating enzyme
MKVVSVIKESFMEYEDYISLVLFSYGCNMKCSYCYNYFFINNRKNIIKKPIKQIIDEGVTGITDGLVFLGGEPTIYGKELFRLSTYVKQNYDLSVKLFTNGTNPELIFEGIQEGHFDKVSIDFKSHLSSPDISYGLNWDVYVQELEELLTQFKQEEMLDKVEIRTTVTPNLIEEAKYISKLCGELGVLFIRQDDVKVSYSNLDLLN